MIQLQDPVTDSEFNNQASDGIAYYATVTYAFITGTFVDFHSILGLQLVVVYWEFSRHCRCGSPL